MHVRHLLSFLLFLLIPLTLQAQSEDPDVIEFAFLTDTHKWGPTADIRFADNNIKAFVQYCNEHPSIQFALHGGDFMNAYDTKHEQALYCLEHGVRDFADLKIPLYTTRGNHDCNGKQRDAQGRRDNSQIITDHEYYERCSPLSPRNPLYHPTDVVIDPERPEGNFYYRDFPRQRFRLIVLNDYDLDSLEFYGYHGEQMKWLAEKALDFTSKPDASEWCFLVLGHGFGFNMFGKPISRLLHAYVNGQDFDDSDRGYTYHCKFNQQPRAKLVALLGGHNHEDLYDCPDHYNILHINRGFATGGEVGDSLQELCFDHFYLNVREHTLYEHRIGRGRDHLFSYATYDEKKDELIQHGELLTPSPTFPEAMGMGGFTQGGVGGRVLWVTNLNDSGPGSLRDAVSQRGSRLVCFKVSGQIRLLSPLVIDHDSISIFGQSAPGAGIAIEGQRIQVNASNVIMRYLRLRGCELADGDFGQTDLMFDHLSCSFTAGPAISIRRAQNVTVQNCLVSHTLGDAIIAGGYMSTYYRNLVTSCPNAFHFPDNEGENRWIHIYRNVIDNWQQYAMYGGGRGGEVTIEENYLHPGPATVNTQMLTVAPDGTGRYYTNGNGYTGQEWIRDQWGLVDDHLGLPYDPDPSEIDYELRSRMDPVARPSMGSFASTCLVIAAFHYRGLFTRPTKNQTWREALAIAGCSIVRDSYDLRLISMLSEGRNLGGTNGLFSVLPDVGGMPTIRQRRHEVNTTNLHQWLNDRVPQTRSIVILYDCDIQGNLDSYPLLAGYREAISTDTCHVGIVSLGNYLAPYKPDLQDDDAATTTSLNDITMQIMKLTNYDAIALGDHETSHPIPLLEKALRPSFAEITCCDIIKRDEHHPYFKHCVIQPYGSTFRVGYVGISPHATLADLRLIQGSIDQVRQEGAHYVVLLTNLGDGNADTTTRRHLTVQRLASSIHGVNVILDGDTASDPVPSQLLTDRDGKSIVFSRPGGGFANIGKLVIAPDGVITTELLPTHTLRFKSHSVTTFLDQIRP